jgi:ABC-type transport system involved in cytochrome c biogenesis permease subunit
MTPFSNRLGRYIIAALAMIGLSVAFYQLLKDNITQAEIRTIESYTPWSPEAIKTAETLLIQDGGRIKPLCTYANFKMLSLHGARKLKVTTGTGQPKISILPSAWMLDILFRPQFAIQQPTFRVDNSDALVAIGIQTHNKRDRYSYQELIPGREKLAELAQSYSLIEAKKREPIQNQIVDLSSNINTYEAILGWFSFARTGVILKNTEKNDRPAQHADISAMMLTSPEIRKQIYQSQAQGEAIHPALQDILQQIQEQATFARSQFAIIPPTDSAQSNWKNAGDVIMETMKSNAAPNADAVGDIQALETTARAIYSGEATWIKEIQTLKNRFTQRAQTRVEGQHIPLEAFYYKKPWFLYALVFFLIGTLTVIAMWLIPSRRINHILSITTLATTLTGLVLCTVVITIRCIIMQRPPIGNLYDTIIFIGSTIVLLALIVEWLVRRRFALSLAPILGAALVLLARRFELGDARDHMDPLVAVLNSNFWLTIHVITISLGYSAGLLSAFLSTSYILLRGLNLDEGNTSFRRSLTRSVYGMLCLTLFLSLVGTVLGGIWANDSWGRFWGWDPKENGALLIVLWTLAILHARIGGYIREWGLHIAAVGTAIIVTFSWWHVNFLGVGLHNYGFTTGKNTIWVFYLIMTSVLLFAFAAMFYERYKSLQSTKLQNEIP